VTTESNTEAAQVDPLKAFVDGPIDQGSEEAQVEAPITDSATVEEDVIATDEKPKEDGFQKRINKVTKDKYAADKRADDLQARLDKLEKANAADALKKPTLADPDIDYDEEALEKATRNYEIKQGVQSELDQLSATAKAEQHQRDNEKLTADYNGRVEALGKTDYAEKRDSIPNLPAGVADALMQSEDGAAMIYHLGSNLEEAGALANMTPAMAIMQLGKLSAKLSTKPSIKPSAAPEPIEPLGSGGTVPQKSDEDMSMAEFMTKYG
jgi:hypothetical protein